jgi:hypothetical protein
MFRVRVEWASPCVLGRPVTVNDAQSTWPPNRRGRPIDVAAQDVAARDVAAHDVAARDVAAHDVAAHDVAAQDETGAVSGIGGTATGRLGGR